MRGLRRRLCAAGQAVNNGNHAQAKQAAGEQVLMCCQANFSQARRRMLPSASGIR